MMIEKKTMTKKKTDRKKDYDQKKAMISKKLNIKLIYSVFFRFFKKIWHFIQHKI